MKEESEQRIQEIENSMNEPTFWNDHILAKKLILELQTLRDKKEGIDEFDRKNCVVSLFAGVGGDDSEDFVKMLYAMYVKFSEKKGWKISELDSFENSLGGYRSISFSVIGDFAYKFMKIENGVHRLIRISPFNSQGKRQTSFALVESIPLFEEEEIVDFDEREIDFEFSKSGGPGGQNVNKRETAVRATHKKTGITVRVSSERTQESNRKKAVTLLVSKIKKLEHEQNTEMLGEFKISGKIENDWGSQMRTYTLHPYQLVKDHRSGFETGNVKKILIEGDLEEIINSVLL